MQAAAEKTRAGSALPELLAPARDWEAMRAAVLNGADAVYFGLSKFNARFRAHNFTADELPEVMTYLHGHNVRGYVAFNTLIFSDELPEAIQFVQAIAAAGVDAVIVQDLGIAQLISRMCPGLHVHGSTQMTLTEPMGIEFIRALGVRRVILARELSISDIRKIHQASDLPIEVFVHGALCVAYSGQCLTSESLGGRSANRGQCAQACRLPYELIVDGQAREFRDKSYLLSPQDLAAYDLISDLADAGVCSLKIEGRLKSAPYVASTTQTYRAAIDALAAGQSFALPREQELDLAQTFSRGFTHGFLDGVNHQELVHARFPKSRGIKLGTITGITRTSLIVELDPPASTTAPRGFTTGGQVQIGDGIVIDEGHPDQPEQGGRVSAVHSHGGFGRGNSRSAAPIVEITLERLALDLDAVAVGAIVWKTDSPQTRQRLQASYQRDRVVRRIPLTATVQAGVGGPLVISVRDDEGHVTEVAWAGPVQAAMKHPLTEAAFREQFGRMGDSPFELSRIIGLEEPSEAMIPKSILNDLRRQAVRQLLEARASEMSRTIVDADALEHARQEIACNYHNRFALVDQPQLRVLVRTLEQLSAAIAWRSPADGRPLAGVYCDFEDVRKYKEAVAQAKAAQLPIGLGTIRIVKPGEEGLLRQVGDLCPDFVLVRNLAGLRFFKLHFPQLPLVGDYALNIANEVTASIVADAGVCRMVPSYDLSWRQLSALIDRFPAAAFETVIHQHMPMFHMEHCVFAHTLSNGRDYRTCGRPCDRHQVDLRDRAGAKHALIADVGCRNTVFNAAAQSAAEFIPRMKTLGIRHFRIELLREDGSQSAELLDRYARVIAGIDDGRATWRQLRVLNQLGVTRGTLEEEPAATPWR